MKSSITVFILYYMKKRVSDFINITNYSLVNDIFLRKIFYIGTVKVTFSKYI